MKISLEEKLEKLHFSDKHNEIIEIIEKLDEKDVNSSILGKLARAYNNVSEYKKAYKILKKCEKEEKENSIWNYRLGYTLFYMEKYKESEKYFKKALKINPYEEDANLFLMWIYQEYAKEAFNNENIDFEKVIKYILKSLEYAKIETDEEGIFWANSRLGWIYDNIWEYDKALPYLKEAIKIKSDDIFINSEFAFSLARNGEFENAIKYATKAVELGRNDDWINVEFGYYYSNLGNYLKAIEYYNKAKELGRDDFLNNYEIARCLISIANYDEAIEILKKWSRKRLEQNDKLFLVSNLSYACRLSGKYEEAIKYGEKAIKLGRDDSWINLELGLSHYENKNLKKALKYFEKVLNLDENNSLAYLSIAKLYREKGEYEIALDYLLKAEEFNKNDIFINSEIAWFYNELKEYEKGIEYCQKAIDLGRNDAWVYNEIGNAYSRIRKFDEALENLKIVLSIDNTNDTEKIFANSEIGWIYNQLEQREEGLKYLFVAKDLGRDDIWINSEIGWALIAFPQKYEEAEKYLLKVLSMGRNDVWLYSQLAYLYNAMNKKEIALEYLLKAKEINPYDSWILYHLAIIYRERGEINKAIELLNVAYEINEYQGWLDLQLAWCYALIEEKEEAKNYLKNVNKYLSSQLENDDILKKDYEIITNLINSFTYLN